MNEANPLSAKYREILARASEYTIIDDGQFRYPVLTSEIEKAGKTPEHLRWMEPEEYGAWCSELTEVCKAGTGTQECIDLCVAMLDAGSGFLDVSDRAID